MHAFVYIVQNILHTACFFFLLPSNRFYCILLRSALLLLLPSDGWEYNYNIFLIIPPLTHSPFHKFTHSSLIRSPTHLFTNSPSHLSTYPLTQPIHPTHQQKCIENCLLTRAERSLEYMIILYPNNHSLNTAGVPRRRVRCACMDAR